MTMEKNRIDAGMLVSRVFGLFMISSVAAFMTYSQDSMLPFTYKVTERTENLPVYVAPPQPNLYNSNPNFKVGWGIDSPIGSVIIEGEVWVLFNVGNQYGQLVKIARFKGTDFEHTVRQADGVIEVEKGVSTHFCGGMWYDTSTGKLYAPIHCEYDRSISPPAGWTRKKTRLATSTDKGLTWHLEGDILTDCLPNAGDWLRFSGSYFEAGPGDFDFYVDNLGGYFYIYSCNSYAPKNGRMNNFLWFNEVARCAIGDKMAPGKWHKFCNGGWTEPGLGGKSSKVSMDSYGMYGRLIYSTYLKKYLRIGIRLGTIDKRFTNLGFGDASIYISTCDDLAKQEWTPMTKLFDAPSNDKFGFTLTDVNSVDPFVCGQSLQIYNYWLYNIPSRALEVTFGRGTTALEKSPRYGSYAYEPLPESGDRIVSRKTKIVGCTSSDNIYNGGSWNIRNDPNFYQTQVMECTRSGSSVKFSFKGGEIYWRAIADKDGGKADVYLDGKSEGVVDCYYPEPLPFQFAFIRSGLDPRKVHTIEMTIRSDGNPRSTGTAIRHMAFEYSAESYRASAGFCSVIGKNSWYYQGWDGKKYSDLQFFDFRKTVVKNEKSGEIEEQRSFANFWSDESNCRVGNNYQIPGDHDAVRTWISPHNGKIRIEGSLLLANDSGGVAIAQIKKNTSEAWPSRIVTNGKTIPHDLILSVQKGDAIHFIVKRGKGNVRASVIWDPVITYEEKASLPDKEE
jgi:hypothetical protein